MGTAAVMEGILATTAAINTLFLLDARLRDPENAGEGADVLQRAYEIRLDRLALISKLEAQVAGLKARDAAECLDLQQARTPPDATAHERTYAEISAVEEIAGILTISAGAAAAFLSQSRRVCSLPAAYHALSTGALSWQHAKIIADETDTLDHPTATALAEHFLDPDAPNPARGCPATDLVPSRFRAKVRAWRERHHPDSIEKRHTTSAADRRVEYTRDRDGMAWISAYLPADSAAAIWNTTTATARGLQAPAETRTLTQIRADEFTRRLLTHTTDHPSTGSSHPRTGSQGDAAFHEQIPDAFIGFATLVGSDQSTAALDIPNSTRPATNEHIAATSNPNAQNTNGSENAPSTEHASPDLGKVPTPRADVLVTVPVFSLLGLTDEPAILDGYGPIPASMARKLLTEGAGSFTRVLIDPQDGAPLEIGRTSYRLTKAMKQALLLRDGKCTFPGCNNPTPDNDTDHLQAWQHGGTTGISNLAQLCPKHHRLKHNSGWTPTPATQTQPPGWTSPTGRQYTSEHPDREPTTWPDQELNTVRHHHDPPGHAPSTADAWHLPEWLESAPPCTEPEDHNLIDADDIAPYDPVWDDFYATPFVLPPDPQKDMALDNRGLGNCVPVLT